MKETKKKKNGLLDRMIDIVLICFAVGVVFTIVAVVHEKYPKKSSTSQTTASVSSSAATEEPEVDEKYITRYSNVISDGSDSENSGSIFYLELNENDSTYKEYLKAGKSKSEIDHGTYERTQEAIETVDKNNTKNKLYFMDSYLISENALFEGEVPKGKKFKMTFTNEAEGESKVVLKFKKDGTYTQNVVRYAASLDGSDTQNASEGTYERKGDWIYRKKDDGTEMMPLMIYKGQLCTSYYKLESKAQILS